MSNHIAMCGLNCSQCDAFIATQKNSDRLRAKTAQQWTAQHLAKGDKYPPLRPEQINCRGCLSQGPLFLNCRTCAIRKCGLSKGITNCQQCTDYKCDRLLAFEKRMW